MSELLPINDTWLSGRPWFCRVCNLGYPEFMACEDVICELEKPEVARARLHAANTRNSSNQAPSNNRGSEHE